MILLGLSDVVWNAIIAGVFAVILEWMRRKTAEKVEEVKTDLKKTAIITDQKLDSIVGTTEVTGKLVNHQYGVALNLAANALEVIAREFPTSENKKSANEARLMSRDHDESQARVDKDKAEEMILEEQK